MATFNITIPDELVEIIKKRNGTPKKYIEAVLINPLLDQLEQDTKKEIFAVKIADLDNKLQEHRKTFTIKAVKET